MEEPQVSKHTSLNTSGSSHRSPSHSTQPISRLTSLKTHASTSTKNTAFYSAHSQFADTSTEASFHTAGGDEETHIVPVVGLLENTRMAQSNSGLRGYNFGDQQGESEEALYNALAERYVIDAEAAGSLSASHPSRRNTEASAMNGGVLGGDRMTTSSEDAMPMPQPLLGQQMLGRDYQSGSAEKIVEPAYAGSLSEKTTKSSSEGRALSERLRDEEVEDDANEASHFVSTRLRYPPPQYSVRADAKIPVGAMLFAAGFLLLPLWWVGAVFPRKDRSDVASTWRKYNALMALLSLPLLGMFLALGGWQATHN